MSSSVHSVSPVQMRRSSLPSKPLVTSNSARRRASTGGMVTSKEESVSANRIPSRRRWSLRSSSVVVEGSSPNVVQWLQQDCPHDVIPHVLAFCGPQMTAVLQKTSRFWRGLIAKESTWRILCEDLYKWKPSEPEPASWKFHYRLNPCVPVDYPSIHAALAVAHGDHLPPRANRALLEQRRSVCVRLRPGKYILREALVIQALPGVCVTIETMDLPKSIPLDALTRPENNASSSKSRSSKRPHKRAAKSLKKIMGCKTSAAVLEDDDLEPSETLENSSSEEETLLDGNSKRRASLILRTRRSNEPLSRVRYGTLKLRNVNLQHFCPGMDIWNGNAAVQIQPPLDLEGVPLFTSPRPCAELEHVVVSSKSGRGIVNIEGGHVAVRRCCVSDCAATGIYVGGPGSEAIVEDTDVVRNGNGNQIRRGIPRGHSGVYLEQGDAVIRNCNISRNSLTGISAVSPENAILTLEGSHLMSNGSYQLEMPPLGTPARDRSSTTDNQLAVAGLPPSRSGLLMD